MRQYSVEQFGPDRYYDYRYGRQPFRPYFPYRRPFYPIYRPDRFFRRPFYPFFRFPFGFFGGFFRPY